MEGAIGKMGMAPAVFWAMSWPELFAAFEGFAAFHNPPDKNNQAPVSRSELEELMKEHPD